MPLKKIGLGFRSGQERSGSIERSARNVLEHLIGRVNSSSLPVVRQGNSFGSFIQPCSRDCLGRGAVLKLINFLWVTPVRILEEARKEPRRGKERLSETSTGNLPVYQ